MRLEDPATGRVVHTLDEGDTWVDCLAFRRDGRALAAIGWAVPRGRDPETGREWAADTAAQVHMARESGRETIVFAAHDNGGRAAAALAATRRTLRLWAVPGGSQLWAVDLGRGDPACLAFSPDGGTLAVGEQDGTVRLRVADGGRELLPLRGHDGLVCAVAFAPDGRRLASAGLDRSVRIWDATSGRQLLRLEGHSRAVRAVAFSPGGDLLASAGNDDRLRLWDTSTGQELCALQCPGGAATLAFAPDGSAIAANGRDGEVRVWDRHRPRGSPERRWAVWHRERAAASEREGLWPAADFHLRALPGGMKDPATLARHANVMGNRAADGGQFAEAAAHFAEAVRLAPDDPLYHARFCLVLLALADEAAWAAESLPHPVPGPMLTRAVTWATARAARSRLLLRFPEIGDPAVAGAVARVAVLGDMTEREWRAAAQLIQSAARESRREMADVYETAGALLYRAGRYTDAVGLLNKAAELAARAPPASVDYYLAMAHHHAGNVREARDLYRRGKARMTAKEDGTTSPPRWDERVRTDLLFRESRTLVGDL